LGINRFIESKSLARFCCEFLNLQRLAESACFIFITQMRHKRGKRFARPTLDSFRSPPADRPVGARDSNPHNQTQLLAELQSRPDTLYEDRLDGRIDVKTYDAKAARIARQQQILWHETQAAMVAVVAPVKDVINFLVAISDGVASYRDRETAKRRDLLRLVSEAALRKGGELRMSFKKPFANLRL
jgi:hypothetical protein